MNEPGENREEDPEEMEEGMEGEYPEEMGNPEDMEEPIEGEEGQEEPIEGEMEDPEMGAPKDEDTDEDDEDEFPPYANEENKKLDQIVHNIYIYIYIYHVDQRKKEDDRGI